MFERLKKLQNVDTGKIELEVEGSFLNRMST